MNDETPVSAAIEVLERELARVRVDMEARARKMGTWEDDLTLARSAQAIDEAEKAQLERALELLRGGK